MKRSILSMTIISACLLGGPLQIVACSSSPSGESSEAKETGTLRLPLVTQANGHTYRLNAYIDIYGPTYAYLYAGGDTTETVLSTTLQTGDYYAYMYSWSMERLDDNGVYQPVAATLTSDYYVGFSIYNQSSTTISFQFSTDGIVITMGSGQLNVNVGVNEVAPACTVLGNDCPSGTWCPPPGLTGRPISCVYAGSVPLGQPCESPIECVAKSSCIDLGSGPVCTGICSIENIGNPCASGGTCTQASVDYGVCVPDGSSLPDAGAGGGSGTGGSSGIGGKTFISTTGGTAPFRT